jgi:hypothetical protein
MVLTKSTCMRGQSLSVATRSPRSAALHWAQLGGSRLLCALALCFWSCQAQKPANSIEVGRGTVVICESGECFAQSPPLQASGDTWIVLSARWCVAETGGPALGTDVRYEIGISGPTELLDGSAVFLDDSSEPLAPVGNRLVSFGALGSGAIVTIRVPQRLVEHPGHEDVRLRIEGKREAVLIQIPRFYLEGFRARCPESAR